MADFYENGDTRASSDALSTFHCINASFQILTGQGEALNIDLKDFYTILYAQLMRLPLLPSHQHISTTSSRYNQTAVELGLQGVNLMFMKRKEMSVDRVAAFVKRLITISLQLPSNATLSCLIMAQKLISVRVMKRNGLMLNWGINKCELSSYRNIPKWPTCWIPLKCRALASSELICKTLSYVIHLRPVCGSFLR